VTRWPGSLQRPGDEQRPPACCGRAICRDCTAEVGLSCSCKGRCESVVATMNDLVERGRTAYQKTRTLQLRNAIFVILLGIVFVSIISRRRLVPVAEIDRIEREGHISRVG